MVDSSKGLNVVIGAFIAIIVGVVLAQVIGDQIKATSSLISVSNESITISNTNNVIVNESITITSGSGDTLNTSVVRVGFFGNGTNNTDLAAVTIGEEVNFTRDGVIRVSTDQFPGASPYNISYNYTSDATGNTANEDVLSVGFFGNGNVSTHVTGIEVGGEINFTKPGVITVSTLNFSAENQNISYTYEGALFVNNSTARTLLKLIPLFFVLAIVAIGIAMFKDSFKDMF